MNSTNVEKYEVYDFVITPRGAGMITHITSPTSEDVEIEYWVATTTYPTTYYARHELVLVCHMATLLKEKLAMSTIHGPYCVTEDTIDRSSTRDATDLGRWYIVVCGCVQFQESEAKARETMDTLNNGHFNDQ